MIYVVSTLCFVVALWVGYVWGAQVERQETERRTEGQTRGQAEKKKVDKSGRRNHGQEESGAGDAIRRLLRDLLFIALYVVGGMVIAFFVLMLLSLIGGSGS